MQTLANHATKVNNALALSRIGGWTGSNDHDTMQGPCHASALAMLDAIPDEVIAALPARLLAQLIDANWALAQQSKAIAAAEAIAEGAVWDARSQRLREIAA